MSIKKTPASSQAERLSGNKDQRLSQADHTRRDHDKQLELTIGLRDMDYAIKWYFENVIKPEVVHFGDKVKVPVVYGAPEKWKGVQADGYYRDKDGKIMVPLIAFKRTGITKDRTLSSKVDANFPQVYYTQQHQWNRDDRYDQFSVLTNTRPTNKYTTTVIPDFVTLTYEVVIWTDFMEHMNGLVESVIYAEDSYWGEPNRFKFRARVEDFTNLTDSLVDEDRTIKTTFQLVLQGYIITDALVRQLADKYATIATDPRQLAVDIDPNKDKTLGQRKDQTRSADNID